MRLSITIIIKKFMYDAGGFNSRGISRASIRSKCCSGRRLLCTGPMEPRKSRCHIQWWSEPKDIGVLPGQVYSRANSINKRGEVVGFSGLQRDGTESRAFMWSYRNRSDRHWHAGWPVCAGICDQPTLASITGASQTQGMGTMLTTHAFIYQVPETPYRRYSPNGRPGCAWWPFQLWHGH